MRFELFRRLTLRGLRWFWRLKAKNGETVAQSEGYHNKEDALETIDLIQNLPASTQIKIVP